MKTRKLLTAVIAFFYFAVSFAQTVCQTIGQNSALLYGNGYVVGPENHIPDQGIHTDSKWISVTGVESINITTFQHRYYDSSRIYNQNNQLIWQWNGEDTGYPTWYTHDHLVNVSGNDSIRIEFYQGYNGFCIGFLKITSMICSISSNTQNLCTKTIQPYNVNVGDATHDGSTYAWSISPAAPNAVIAGNGTNTITIDWTNVPDGSYTLQAIETSVEGCVSTAVTATINLSATPAPIIQPQTFCANATVANLVATGTNLQWYAAATGGTALDSIAILTTGTYYVSQTIGTCESVRTAVVVTISPQVNPTFTQIASTCSGSNLTALPATSNNGITGTWSPAINNNVTTTYTFTPDAGQCATTTTQTITITTPKITSAISFVAPPVTVVALPNVTIGTQVWTNKNLDVSTYRDGTPIPQVTDSAQWANLTTGAWCYYNNDPVNGAIYGKLYNWYAVAGIYDAASLNDPTLRKQFAPIGWHVPSYDEWTTIADYLGEFAGNKMKETGIAHWYSPNQDATNSSGFTGLPVGLREYYGAFNYVGSDEHWWSSTEGDTSSAWYRSLRYYSSGLFRANSNKDYGFSVRLVKD